MSKLLTDAELQRYKELSEKLSEQKNKASGWGKPLAQMKNLIENAKLKRSRRIEDKLDKLLSVVGLEEFVQNLPSPEQTDLEKKVDDISDRLFVIESFLEFIVKKLSQTPQFDLKARRVERRLHKLEVFNEELE